MSNCLVNYHVCWDTLYVCVQLYCSFWEEYKQTSSNIHSWFLHKRVEIIRTKHVLNQNYQIFQIIDQIKVSRVLLRIWHYNLKHVRSLEITLTVPFIKTQERLMGKSSIELVYFSPRNCSILCI